MKFLVCNDDGYLAEGIHVLAQTLSHFGEVRVVAPERDRSGASNSLTLDRPLSLKKGRNGFFYVNGTPTDCVHLALNIMDDFIPDMVFSGINHGANMGDDTLYSGTVAAATEAYLLDIPAVAVSLNGKVNKQFETAAHVVRQFAQFFVDSDLKEPFLWNLNVPNIPKEELSGIKTVRLGRRHHSQNLIPIKSPRGETVYWIGPAGAAKDEEKGTDFWAVANNFVALTPLSIDLTDAQALSYLSQSVQSLNVK
ncbi:5'/3'-nucleotidase SurE [Neisseria sp. Ec49-e6-T10]|uniref:5'/3'-nucleotidase SurE n=1 Tax=Neisseria sp. Ec49-e6-T10 TaxID=3140744 RepID=UPI003EB9DED6